MYAAVNAWRFRFNALHFAASEIRHLFTQWRLDLFLKQTAAVLMSEANLLPLGEERVT